MESCINTKNSFEAIKSLENRESNVNLVDSIQSCIDESRSEFELLMTQVLGELHPQGKDDEATDLFAFVGAANFILKNQEGLSTQKVEDLSKLHTILESKTALQKGYHKGEAESQTHFEEHKSKAIDILSAILQDIKA